jgi:hypothetical protein
VATRKGEAGWRDLAGPNGGWVIEYPHATLNWGHTEMEVTDMRGLFSRFALATMLMVATTVVFAPAASAAIEDCPNLGHCGWSDYNFSGQMTTFSPGSGCTNAPFPLASVANTFPKFGVQAVFTVFSGSDCTGTRIATVRGEESYSFLAQPGFSVHAVI